MGNHQITYTVITNKCMLWRKESNAKPQMKDYEVSTAMISRRNVDNKFPYQMLFSYSSDYSLYGHPYDHYQCPCESAKTH